MKKTIVAILLAACGFISLADNVVYVATNGSNANDGSESHPFASLDVAISQLGADGGTVIVKAGTYSFSTSVAPEELQGSVYTAGASCIYISTPVEIVGATGNPADVTFKRDSAAGSARVFMLDHADAKLQYVTVQDGKFTDGIRNGGNVLIGYNGGTVEDCILKDGNAGNANNTNIGGGNIALMAGRCSRCVITGGTLSFYRPIGLNVMAAGSSVVENCLITKGVCNSVHEAAQDEGAVALKDNAKLVNCTVVKNFANRFSGVNILSGNARAINCIIACNTVRYETDTRGSANDGWANGVSKNNSNLGCYVNCATDLDTSVYPQLNNTCFAVTEEDFTDAENEDWHMRPSSAAINNGTDYSQTGATSQTDLDGNARTSDGYVDIGCYQNAPSFDARFSASSLFGVIPGTSEIVFSATAYHPAGPMTYTWDFADGTTLVTGETTVSHTYTVTGTYIVSVTASDGTDSVSYTFPDISITSFDCDFAMLTTNLMIGADAHFRVENLSASGMATFTWDFGDGSIVESTDIEVTHAYSAAGKYTVSVVADGGAEGSKSHTFEATVDVIQKDVYVNRTGSETFPFDTEAKGAKTPAAALAYAVDGCVLHVLPGEYDLKNKETNVMRGVHVVGEGEKPEETVFKGYGTNNGKRNIRVDHEDAWVENLTLDGGFADYSTGGNLYLGAGTVTNCILRNGRSNSNGGGGGGAFVKGGLLTHCVITNSYLGNRGNGIALQQTGGRVSNCLIGYNKREWLNSRNAFSVVNVTGGIIDNCTIVGMALLKYNVDVPFQMSGSSDTGVNVGTNGKAYNCVMADFRYYQFSDSSHWAEYAEESPSRWRGTAANFVNCATDDAAAINETCFVGSLEKGSLFADYANRDLTPGTVLKNKGVAIYGYVFPSVDLAGNQRVYGSAIDIGCFERQPTWGMTVIIR